MFKKPSLAEMQLFIAYITNQMTQILCPSLVDMLMKKQLWVILKIWLIRQEEDFIG